MEPLISRQGPLLWMRSVTMTLSGPLKLIRRLYPLYVEIMLVPWANTCVVASECTSTPSAWRISDLGAESRLALTAPSDAKIHGVFLISSVLLSQTPEYLTIIRFIHLVGHTDCPIRLSRFISYSHRCLAWLWQLPNGNVGSLCGRPFHPTTNGQVIPVLCATVAKYELRISDVFKQLTQNYVFDEGIPTQLKSSYNLFQLHCPSITRDSVQGWTGTFSSLKILTQSTVRNFLPEYKASFLFLLGWCGGWRALLQKENLWFQRVLKPSSHENANHLFCTINT